MERLIRSCTDNLLVSAAICFIAGASAAFYLTPWWPANPERLAVIAVLLSLPLLAFLFIRRLRPLAALFALFLTGLVHTHGALQPVDDPHHIAFSVTQPTKVTLVGRMMTMAEYDGEQTRWDLDSEALLPHDSAGPSAFRPIRGKVRLTVPGALAPEFVPGKKMMVMATLDRFRNYQTPGAFDYRLHLAAQDILCSGWIRSPREILSVAEPLRPGWRDLSFLPERIRQQAAEFFAAQFDRDEAGFFQALLIGSTVNISPRLIEAFKDNGCFHVLSISGLHLGLLGVFCAALFTWLLKRSTWLLLHVHVPTLALTLTAPILLFYTFIAGFNVPAVRSLITALLVLFAVMVRRQRTLIHLIAGAALIVLAVTPLALFTASFQLSFAAVLAINLIYPRLPLFLAPEEASSGLSSQIGRAVRVLQSMLYVSLAATAGTLPILLYHFNRVSLIGPVMNLVIEPLLCLWALPCGLLALPLIPLFPNLAVLLCEVGRPAIELTVWLSEAVARLPHASVWTITPNAGEIVLYYCLLILLLRPEKTVRRLVLALGLALVLAGSFTRSLWLRETRQELTVSFLDVGQGTCTLVQLPDGGAILIDGGAYQSEQFDPGQSLIAPFLWRQRIWRLDGLIITHPHQDHYNGLSFVAARFRPQRAIVNGDPGEEPDYQTLMRAIRAQGGTVNIAKAGDVLHEGEEVKIACLGMNDLPGQSAAGSVNDRSLVVRLQYKTRSFLFPGDIGTPSENRLLRAGIAVQSDVLLAPHHGSRTSAGASFMDAVAPALIVVSAGRRGQGTHPAKEHLARWRQLHIPTLVTARTGTVTVRTNGKDMRVATRAGERLRFGNGGEDLSW
ncbi:MAG: DNA internalization-related competence protein ComEC/Rec2 [Desulfobulbus sp.]|jgi:competence protein ComEC|uniref:DNA internalization-related competence protein ComEC/Rec2 n=1 Tax=Desulfobulbus sp. TaxID=895 RepID=UPI00284770B6|nr:DNA internalization-related competence protein ComEC/Rec2 [Desulfobulbus sp.]MDR2549957.1 DNA internalization-related competence protein ComEC/Rec2 [Desulfobulbus sp.]